MLKNERQHEIMHILKHRRYATVEQLTKELFASASSIRRDLTELELRGLVKRSYGARRTQQPPFGGHPIFYPD